MAWYADLEPCDYWYFGSHLRLEVTSVGWLEGDQPFTQGPVAPEVTERLNGYAHKSWQPGYFLGFHECSLPATETQAINENCATTNGSPQATPEQEGTCGKTGLLNIFIPYQGVIYAAPELIHHYITEHGYAPPAIFCEAVLNAPAPGSDAYFAELRTILPDGQKYRIDKFIEEQKAYQRQVQGQEPLALAESI